MQSVVSQRSKQRYSNPFVEAASHESIQCQEKSLQEILEEEHTQKEAEVK